MAYKTVVRHDTREVFVRFRSFLVTAVFGLLLVGLFTAEAAGAAETEINTGPDWIQSGVPGGRHHRHLPDPGQSATVDPVSTGRVPGRESTVRGPWLYVS